MRLNGGQDFGGAAFEQQGLYDGLLRSFRKTKCHENPFKTPGWLRSALKSRLRSSQNRQSSLAVAHLQHKSVHHERISQFNRQRELHVSMAITIAGIFKKTFVHGRALSSFTNGSFAPNKFLVINISVCLSLVFSDTVPNAGGKYGIIGDAMERARKITVEISPELLERAQRASGVGVTQTVRTGLQLVAASETYAKLSRMRGKVRFTRTSDDLKVDR